MPAKRELDPFVEAAVRDAQLVQPHELAMSSSLGYAAKRLVGELATIRVAHAAYSARIVRIAAENLLAARRLLRPSA